MLAAPLRLLIYLGLGTYVFPFSHLMPRERLFHTHLNMFRVSPDRYAKLFNLTLEEGTAKTTLQPFIFYNGLYESAQFHANELANPSTQNCTRVSNETCQRNCAQFHGCGADARISHFCIQCQESFELVNPSRFLDPLISFQEEVLVKQWADLTNPLMTTLAIDARHNVTVFDFAQIPLYKRPFFYDGAHLLQNTTARFWVNSANTLPVSVVFYNQNMVFLDEFQMTQILLQTFYFEIPIMVLRRLNEHIDNIYYSFSTELAEKAQYSDVFILYFETD